MKTYKGKFRPKNTQKYEGDFDKITYRSMWERQVFRWCDTNSKIVKWSSEEVIIPYRCKTDGKLHRYFTDLKIVTTKGETIIVEIKPESQTRPPKQPKRKSQRHLREVTTYIKNSSKWEAAEYFCEKRGWVFAIWTEKTIKSLGIKLLT